MKLTIPSWFLPILTNSAIITRFFDNRLLASSKKEWERQSERLENIISEKKLPPNSIQYVKLVIKGATEVAITKKGEFVLPSYLKEYADIRKDVVFIKSGNSLEIWGKENYETYMKAKKKKD